MIDRKELRNEFYRLFAKTNGTMYLDDIAKSIDFAIVFVPILLKAFPDDNDLPWMIRSFMRRAFRNALRVTVGNSHSDYAMQIADELAEKAGFDQYRYGSTVSIFECIEKDPEDILEEDLKLSE